MKAFLSIFIFVLLTSCSGDPKIPVQINDVNGLIFSENYKFEYDDEEIVNPGYFIPHGVAGIWTPTFEDINDLENKIGQSKVIPFSYPALKIYFRQYIGFVDSAGEKNIHTIFSNLENVEEILKEMPLMASDGDSLYFTVDYNLNDSTFYDFRFY